jgi:hypothetical protein
MFESAFQTEPKGKDLLSYFFLVGFLVAFFFIVLFSLGLDLDAALPGFFLTGIRVPPLGSLLLDKRSELIDVRIIEICYVRIKSLTEEFRKKF